MNAAGSGRGANATAIRVRDSGPQDDGSSQDERVGRPAKPSGDTPPHTGKTAGRRAEQPRQMEHRQGERDEAGRDGQADGGGVVTAVRRSAVAGHRGPAVVGMDDPGRDGRRLVPDADVAEGVHRGQAQGDEHGQQQQREQALSLTPRSHTASIPPASIRQDALDRRRPTRQRDAGEAPPAGTTATGHAAWWSTPWLTEPSIVEANSPSPRELTTTRSAVEEAFRRAATG